MTCLAGIAYWFVAFLAIVGAATCTCAAVDAIVGILRFRRERSEARRKLMELVK